MKLERGRFIAKMRDGAIHELYFFLEISQDKKGVWWYRVDEGNPQLLDTNARDHILQEMFLVYKFRNDERPEFRNVQVTIRAESVGDSEFIWNKRNGEVLEKLLSRFPTLVDVFWTDGNRKKKIWEYLRQKYQRINGKRR